jgi:hypothetical protein
MAWLSNPSAGTNTASVTLNFTPSAHIGASLSVYLSTSRSSNTKSVNCTNCPITITSSTSSPLRVSWNYLTPGRTYYVYANLSTAGEIINPDYSNSSITTAEADLSITDVSWDNSYDVLYNSSTGKITFYVSMTVKNPNASSKNVSMSLSLNGTTTQTITGNAFVSGYGSSVTRTNSVTYSVGANKTAGTYTVSIPYTAYSYWTSSDGTLTSGTLRITYTVQKNNIYFNGASPLTTSLRGTPVNESILATQWNKFCENISGMSSYGNKSTDDIIKQTEV